MIAFYPLAIWAGISIAAFVVCFALPSATVAALDRACRLIAAHRLGVEDARAANRERNPERYGALDAETAAGIGVGVTHFERSNK